MPGMGAELTARGAEQREQGENEAAKDGCVRVSGLRCH